MKLCGAKTRSGKPCRGKAMANGRCRMHGGTSPGAPKGNQNARKHGIYSKAMIPEELEIYDSIEVGNIDEEIKVAKLQLLRALKAQNKADDGDNLELFEEITSSGGEDIEVPEGVDAPAGRTTVKRKRREYEGIINTLLGRIGDLESKRAEMIAKSSDGNDDMTDVLGKLIDKLPG